MTHDNIAFLRHDSCRRINVFVPIFEMRTGWVFGNRRQTWHFINRDALHVQQFGMDMSSHNNDKPKPMLPYYKHHIQKILDELNVMFLLMSRQYKELMSSMTLGPYGVVRDANAKRGPSSSETMWLLLI